MESQIQKLTSVVSTFVALQVVTLATVVGASWYSHNELKLQISRITSSTGQARTPVHIENWASQTREYNAVQGREDAAVVVLEYSDFQCPFCKKYSDETRQQISAEYGDKVRMVFKHYPLTQIHPQAMTAAIAAQCAKRQGKFWEMHDRFFGQPNALDVESVIAAGKSLGLSDNYVECVRKEETRGEVEQDMRDAMEIGVQGTPSLLVNGELLVGAQSEATLKHLFEKSGLVE
jgi:protein-disulfide isomerase